MSIDRGLDKQIVMNSYNGILCTYKKLMKELYTDMKRYFC